MGAKPLTVAVDASPLIGLAKIRKLRLLAKLYPVVVLKDAASQGLIRDLAKTLHRLQQKGFGIFDYAKLIEGND